MENTKSDLDTRFLFHSFHLRALLTLISLKRTPNRRREWEVDTVILFHCTFQTDIQESIVSSRSSVKAAAKENWPVGPPTRTPLASAEQPNRKASFEPQLPQPSDDVQDGGDGGTEMSSVVDSEEWIGEDDRASDSIAPSVMSEPEYQRHRLLMQHPPRSFPSSLVI